MIDTRLLTFLMLVQTKSYTKTAQALFITQPAVTHHIKTLEKDNNIKLFANTKTFRLSLAGQIIYEYAKKCELLHLQLKQALEAEESPKQVIKLATTKYISSIFMRKILTKWMIKHPTDKIKLVVADKNEIISMIHNGSIDFGIIDSNYDETILNGRALMKMNLSLYASTNHTLSHKQKITIDQLKKETLVFNEFSGATDALDDLLRKNNLSFSSLNNYALVNDPDIIKEMLLNGNCISIMYDEFLKNELADSKVVSIKVDGLNTNCNANLIYSNDTLIERKIISIANEMKEIYDEE